MSLLPGSAHTTASELAKLYAQHIKDKVVLVTGTSPGSIGSAFAHAIVCAQPGQLIIAGRDPYKIKETMDSLTAKCATTRIRTLDLDLASFAAVHRAAKEVNGWNDVPHIDVLVNNAGLMATAWETSPDGYEIDLATNHLGPFLFTNLIMNKIIASPEPRVITVSSSLHRLGPFRFDDYNFHVRTQHLPCSINVNNEAKTNRFVQEGESYNMWQAYGQSKTANSLMAISLAEMLGAKHNLTSLTLHPGVVNSNLFAQVPLSAIQSMSMIHIYAMLIPIYIY